MSSQKYQEAPMNTYRSMQVTCIFAAVSLLIACSNDEATTSEPGQTLTPAQQFARNLANHCGQAFEGRIITNRPAADNDPFENQRLVMHVRECTDEVLYVPFHVGDDRSRTWILTHGPDGLELKHDHRHDDGSDDEITMYGGTSETPGTAIRQEFPVDDFSIRMFEESGLTASLSNVWAMEIVPDERFMYELGRTAEDRLFQVEFDLTRPVPPPPAPWGW